MAMMPFPPGFRFHPTDEELVMYYLKRKNMGKKLLSEAISELNIYKFGPWDLPDKSIMRSGDREWYFFCPREKKSPNGVRTNRATENGFWKATGKDRPVIYDGRTVGMIKTLIFHLGHSPKGERTDWVMHEYRLEDRNLADAGVVQDAYMLCRIFQKSGLGPKNGAQYGAPFHEEEWSDVEETGPESYSRTDGRVQSIPERLCNWSMSKPGPSTVGPSGINTTLFDMDGPPEEDIADELAMLKEDCNMLPIEYNPNEKFETVNNDTSIEGGPYSYDLDIYNNGLRGLNNSAEPREAGFNFSTTQDNPTYLELNDFNSSAALPDGSQWLRQNLEAQGKKFQTFNSEKSTDDLPCSNVLDIFGLGTHNNLVEPTEAGFNFFATQDAGYSLSPMFLGDNNTTFFELDDLDTSLKSPAPLPEGSQDHNLEALRKENGNFEADGFNACTCNEAHIPCTQQEENIIDDHIHELGELLSRSGSSIHFKAEVALKVDECTDDALSFRLEESACMPVQDLVIKVDPFCHLGITSYGIWIFMLLLVDMIAGLFLCDIIAAFKLLHSPSVPTLKMHF